MKKTQIVGIKSIQEHLDILLNSYQKSFNEPLISEQDDPLTALFNADFVVVSHGIEEDPIFNFANQSALNLFEFDYEAFIQLPSRKSAQTISQGERDKLLAEVNKHGCINNYTGIRVSSTGKRFYIENAKVWNLYEHNGTYYGQAAMFKSWTYLEQDNIK